MSDTYKDIGFDSNRIGFGRKAGIVVVDFQKGFDNSFVSRGFISFISSAHFRDQLKLENFVL